jgi:hypothetical protein
VQPVSRSDNPVGLHGLLRSVALLHSVDLIKHKIIHAAEADNRPSYREILCIVWNSKARGLC